MLVGHGAPLNNVSRSSSFFFPPLFFPDTEHLFVPLPSEDYYELVQLCSHPPVLLPFQVTNPLAQGTLPQQFPLEEVPVDGMGLTSPSMWRRASPSTGP